MYMVTVELPLVPAMLVTLAMSAGSIVFGGCHFESEQKH